MKSRSEVLSVLQKISTKIHLTVLNWEMNTDVDKINKTGTNTDPIPSN